MGYKLDIGGIVSHHLKTIVNDNDGKPDFRDHLFFIILPIITSGLLVVNRIFLSATYIGAIISGLAIYVGMSLNLIILIFDMVQKNKLSPFRKSFAKDLIANITFSVLLSILSIVSALCTQIEFKNLDFLLVFKIGTNLIAYFLLIQMLLAIILLVRNMYFQLLDRISE